MNKKPHSIEARKKISEAKKGKRKHILPDLKIVSEWRNTNISTRGLAEKYNCSDSTIKIIIRLHTTKNERLGNKIKKQSLSLKTGGNANKKIGQIAKELNIWKGRKHNAESKKKQSMSKKGIKKSDDFKIKMSAIQQGIEVYNWNGFATTEKTRSRKSIELKEWRIKCFERDNYTCQMCGKKGGTLHCHHIKTFSKHPSLRFDISNGITLCSEPCHKKTIGKETDYEALFCKK